MLQIDKRIDGGNGYEWLKEQVMNTFSKELHNFQSGLLSNHLEKEIAVPNVVGVLEKAVTEFEKNNKFSSVFTINNSSKNQLYGGGYTLALQYGLKKLGFDPGPLDGIYRSAGRKTSRTREAVKKFQIDWNKNNPHDIITVDGWAGKNTLKRFVSMLTNVSHTKKKVVPTPKPKPQKPIIAPVSPPQKPKIKSKSQLEKSEDLIKEIDEFDVNKEAKFRYSYLMSKKLKGGIMDINDTNGTIKADVFFMCKKGNNKNPDYYVGIDQDDPRKVHIGKITYENGFFKSKCIMHKPFETIILDESDVNKNRKSIEDKVKKLL